MVNIAMDLQSQHEKIRINLDSKGQKDERNMQKFILYISLFKSDCEVN